MNKSPYFYELLKTYHDELDDLVTDSEGKPVLQKRLNEKRKEFDAILPMIEFSPEMVAVVFHGAFGFDSPEIMQQLVQSEPDEEGFFSWGRLVDDLSVAAWAEPLIAAALQARGGDVFLVATAALEYLRLRDKNAVSVVEAEAEKEPGDEDDEDGEGDEKDLREAGADWLVEQGFESLER